MNRNENENCIIYYSSRTWFWFVNKRLTSSPSEVRSWHAYKTTKKRIDAIYPKPPFSGLAPFLPWSTLAIKVGLGCVQNDTAFTHQAQSFFFPTSNMIHAALQCRLVDRKSVTSLLFALTSFCLCGRQRRSKGRKHDRSSSCLTFIPAGSAAE